MAMDHIDPLNDRDYHISFDIDALDRAEAPSTGISRKSFHCIVHLFMNFISIFFSIIVPGGLTLREGIRIIDEVFATGRLRGLDLVEVCPIIGDARDVKTTIDSAIQLVSAVSGNKRSGNLPLAQTDIPKN